MQKARKKFYNVVTFKYQNKAICRHLAPKNQSKTAPQAKIWAIFPVALIDFGQFLKGKITPGKVCPPPRGDNRENRHMAPRPGGGQTFSVELLRTVEK